MNITDQLAEALRVTAAAIEAAHAIGSANSSGLVAAHELLCQRLRAYDAQRAEDAEPISEEWLRENGWRKNSGIPGLFNRGILQVDIEPWPDGKVRLGYRPENHYAMPMTELQSRGQLRRIVEAIEGETT